MATAEKGSPLRLSNRVRSSFAGSNIFCLSQTRSVKTLGLHWKTLLRLSCTLVSTLNWVLSAFGNCFENCDHAHFFSEASLAFVSGFRAHLSKSLENPAILESIIFGQYKMVVIRIVKQKNGETVYFDTSILQVHFIKLISRSLYNSWQI